MGWKDWKKFTPEAIALGPDHMVKTFQELYGQRFWFAHITPDNK